MADPRIRLHPDQGVGPLLSAPPLEGALRWRSEHEEGRTWPMDVFMTREAIIRCCVHAASDLDREVGGGLAGRHYADPQADRAFIVVEGVLPARFTRHGSTFLTFTQDTLVAMHDDLEERFPDHELVGWYHTHPRMGVFLSSYDVWLHEHFFPEPWQVALVIEPHAQLGGFFSRDDEGEIDRKRYSGFFECLQDDRSSVVNWHNLNSEPTGGTEEESEREVVEDA
jgi:proteasome lid subunit RPN8/RPN11